MLVFVLSGGSKFWARNLGSKLFVVGQHRRNISIQFVPRGNQKRPTEHSHFWFLAYGRRARLSGRTFALQVAVSLHGIKVWGIKWERKTLSSVLGKSHRYISWTAEVSKDRPERSDCWVLTPVGAKFGKYGAEIGKILPLLSGSALKITFSFSRDTGLLCVDAQLLLWVIKPDYAGSTPQRLELGSSLITQSYASSVSLPFSAFSWGVQTRRPITLSSCCILQQSRVTPGGLSAPLIFSADWRGSLMQVFQWNLYNPDVNPVASPTGFDMSGNEHYWADKISEHFFFPQETHWFPSLGLVSKLPKAPGEAYLGLPVTRYERESSSWHEEPGLDGS